MNRSEFFTTAKITRCPVIVEQYEDNGYGLSLTVQHEGEDEQKFTLLYKGEPRYFKSLKGIETTLKEQGIFTFSVKMLPVEIAVNTRAKNE